MRVYFTTVVRTAPIEQGGDLIFLDWDKKKVVNSVPIVVSDPVVEDPNPRGSTRGGRGVIIRDGEVLAASYHSMLVFDQELNFVRKFTHNLFSNLHEVCGNGANLWCTSTSLDLAVKVSYTGETVDVWSAREDPVTAAKYSLSPLPIDMDDDHRATYAGVEASLPGHVHLNACWVCADGRPLMLLNKMGCVVKLDPTEILVEDLDLRGAHNVLELPDSSILVNDTVRRTVRHYDARGAKIRDIDVTDFRPVRDILRRHTAVRVADWLSRNGRPYRVFHPLFKQFAISRPVFLRGMCLTPKGTVIVGVSPATLLEIDLETGKLIDHYTHARDCNVCVHGIASCD